MLPLTARPEPAVTLPVVDAATQLPPFPVEATVKSMAARHEPRWRAAREVRAAVTGVKQPEEDFVAWLQRKLEAVGRAAGDVARARLVVSGEMADDRMTLQLRMKLPSKILNSFSHDLVLPLLLRNSMVICIVAIVFSYDIEDLLATRIAKQKTKIILPKKEN